MHGLLEGKAAPETVRLAEQAVRAPRGRRLDRVMEAYLGSRPRSAATSSPPS